MSKKSKNPVSLLISELEEMSGGKVLFTERLEDPLPSSPTMDWLLSKEHILFSRPVGTLAFQVKLIRTRPEYYKYPNHSRFPSERFYRC